MRQYLRLRDGVAARWQSRCWRWRTPVATPMPLRFPWPLALKGCLPRHPCGPTVPFQRRVSISPPPYVVKHDVPVLHVWLSSGSLGREREDAVPVVLHADDGPASSLRFVEHLVQPADSRRAVVGPFTLGIGVVHDERQASPGNRE